MQVLDTIAKHAGGRANDNVRGWATASVCPQALCRMVGDITFSPCIYLCSETKSRILKVVQLYCSLVEGHLLWLDCENECQRNSVSYLPLFSFLLVGGCRSF